MELNQGLEPKNKWFHIIKSQKNPKLRLFCFAYGGGSSYAFSDWAKYVSDDIEIIAIALPGRGKRLNEQSYTQWEPLINEIEIALKCYLDVPYVFYGHSLGSCIAFNLTKQLQKNNNPLPQKIYLAACQSPNIPSFEQPISDLSSDNFFYTIEQMKGLPKELLNNKRLVKLIEPALRADVLLAELWKGTENDKVEVPIIVLCGLTDNAVQPDNVKNWKNFTTKEFNCYLFQGDHFFMHTKKKEILEIIELNEITKNDTAINYDEINRTDFYYPEQTNLSMLFENIVREFPNNIAVTYEKQTLTYEQLNKKANQLANYLHCKGVDAGSIVGISLNKSIAMVISIVAIIKAGCAYLPLDLTYPEERLHYMVKDAKLKLVIAEKTLTFLSDTKIDYIILDRYQNELNQLDSDNIVSRANLDSLAYINYTSGTTGKPKGISTIHRGVVRLLYAPNFVNLDHNKKILQISAIGFDAATFEIWGALLHGATCVLYPGRVPSISKLRTYIEKTSITTMFFTAALFNTIIDQDTSILSPLKQILIGGEAPSVPHIRKALTDLTNTDIINMYGPTESTTFATFYPVHYIHTGQITIPMGRPINNTRVYVINSKNRLAKYNEVGELYIAGDGLARGYLQQEKLTSEKFITTNRYTDKNERLYKSGDEVRMLPDGNIDFIGRIDKQVKIHGFRIELKEIETLIMQFPGVKNAVVNVEDNGYDDKKIVAYIKYDVDKPCQKHLVQMLKEKLPNYMLPNHYCWVRKLPMNANGKIDVNQLNQLSKVATC